MTGSGLDQIEGMTIHRAVWWVNNLLKSVEKHGRLQNLAEFGSE